MVGCQGKVTKVEGKVTKVDPSLGFFELDDKFKIYMCLLAQEKEVFLPLLNSSVTIKHLHRADTTFVVCKTSDIKGDFTMDMPPNFITDLVKKYKLGARDLLLIDKALKLIEEHIDFENIEIETLVIRTLFEKLIETQKRKRGLNKQQCLENILNFDVRTASFCKYVEIHSKKYKDFPKWSFGVHPKEKADIVLFGFMFVDPLYGLIMLKDNGAQMLCLATNKTNIQMDYFEKCYAVITDYTVITEIYSERKVPNVECLVVDIKDIFILHSYRSKLLGRDPPDPGKFENSLQFVICRKSTVCMETKGNTVTYLEVILTDTDERIYLILPNDYTAVNVFLKEEFRYRLFHNKLLEKTKDRLLMQIQNLNILRLTDNNAYFQELENVVRSDIPAVVPELQYREYVSNNSGMFSFEAVIETRGFADNKYPDVYKKVPFGFSTLGLDVPKVTFSHEGTNGKKIQMYLSNWLYRLIPFGLVPCMQVFVRNVESKSTYIKPTLFTYFQIVAFKPKAPFVTANLFGLIDCNWGQSYYLSKGNDIPYGVIVWSKIQNVNVNKISLSIRCEKCDLLKENPDFCTACDSEDEKVQFSLSLTASDTCGRSTVLVKNHDFMKYILNINDVQYGKFWRGFKRVGIFNYSMYDENDENEIEETDRPASKGKEHYLASVLKDAIRSFNFALQDTYEFKCRKLYQKDKNSSPNDTNSIYYPLWFLLSCRIDKTY